MAESEAEDVSGSGANEGAQGKRRLGWINAELWIKLNNAPSQTAVSRWPGRRFDWLRTLIWQHGDYIRPLSTIPFVHPQPSVHHSCLTYPGNFIHRHEKLLQLSADLYLLWYFVMGKRARDDHLDENNSITSAHETDLAEQHSPSKFIELDLHEEEKRPAPLIQCSLPPHRKLTFDTLEAFDLHYAKEHTHRCSSCWKNFPSAHFMNLHIDENHNPLREALAAKGERTYACFVEDCDRKCSTPQKRRLHLIDKHLFPKLYNFRVIDHGIDESVSMLQTGRKRRLSGVAHGVRNRNLATQPMTSMQESTSKVQTSEPSSEHNKHFPNISRLEVDENTVQDLEKSMAALQFIPHSLQSKRSSGKQER